MDQDHLSPNIRDPSIIYMLSKMYDILDQNYYTWTIQLCLHVYYTCHIAQNFDGGEF